MRSKASEAGNILFLILLAVVLFAALSYAVTSSMKGGGKNASAEKKELIISQMFQYGALLNATAQRMVLTGRTTAANLRTEYDPVGSMYSSYSCNENIAPIAGPNCLFSPSGGGVAWIPQGNGPDLGAAVVRYKEYLLVDASAGMNIGGTSAGDHVLAVAMRSPEGTDYCTLINQKLGISGIPQTTLFPGGDLAALVSGHTEGCVYSTGDEQFFFYQPIYLN